MFGSGRKGCRRSQFKEEADGKVKACVTEGGEEYVIHPEAKRFQGHLVRRKRRRLSLSLALLRHFHPESNVPQIRIGNTDDTQPLFRIRPS